ncbi:MAG TPA: FAD-dependent oxidoreductase [Rubrobacter sp.]|nr:FAD-dependent oxidoreductase [Rubrobacter sp.]
MELRLSTAARALDRNRRVIEIEGGEEVPYDTCVLATGSEPIRIPIPGADDPGVFVMRTIEDSTRLSGLVEPGDTVAVIGSGFIGCEVAASLSLRGAEITMISRGKLPQSTLLGEAAGEYIRAWLEGFGVRLKLGASLESVERADGGYELTLDSGEKIPNDTVLFGTGARPCTALAETAGLEIRSGRVVTDSSMRTSAPGVFAVGDISFAYNAAAGRHLHVAHWGEALNHGRVAGTVIAGGEAAWDVSPGFWSTMRDKTLKYTAWGDGFDEARLVDHGEDAFTVWYSSEGICTGVLTHNFDEDYARGQKLIESGAPMPL